MTRIQRQIEQLRQADACIPIRDAAGHPLPGVRVWVEQETHDFPFGCVIPYPLTFSDPDLTRFQSRLAELFNQIQPLSSDVDPTSPLSPLRGEGPGVRGPCPLEISEPIHLGLLQHKLNQLAIDHQSVQIQLWGSSICLIEGATDTDERAAGNRLAELYTLCFAHPNVTGIFWNGFADAKPTTRGGGLLRYDLSPKYAYKVLQKLIDFDWHTRANGITDADGCFRFCGFFGEYRVVIETGTSGPSVQSFHLPPP